MFPIMLDSWERVSQSCQSEGQYLHSDNKHKNKIMVLTSMSKKVSDGDKMFYFTINVFQGFLLHGMSLFFPSSSTLSTREKKHTVAWCGDKVVFIPISQLLPNPVVFYSSRVLFSNIITSAFCFLTLHSPTFPLSLQAIHLFPFHFLLLSRTSAGGSAG